MLFEEIALYLLATLSLCHGDTFTSIREMENLFDLEQSLVKSLDNYIRHANFELEVMEKRYDEISRIESEIQDIDKYAENPVNAYSVIKRMIEEWPVTFKLMSNSPFFDEDPTIPDKSELTEAIAHLVEWQVKNNIAPKKLTRGLYEGISPHANLTASDCHEIAAYCLKHKNIKLAVKWEKEALRKIKKDPKDKSHNAELLAKVLEYSFVAKCLTGDLEGSIVAYQNLVADDAKRYKPSYELKSFYDKEKTKKCETAAKEALKTKKPKTSLFKRYDAISELCQTIKMPSSGVCYNYFQKEKLSNMQIEFLSNEPILVLVYHNALTNNVILDIKESAMIELKTLKLGARNGPINLPNKQLVESTNEKLSPMRGYENIFADDVQVTVFGPGASYTSLTSVRAKLETPAKGRVLYFLSDVAKGGYTVFPTMKISVPPTKGSVLIWHEPEGKPPLEVGECPPIVGSKWVLSQSIVPKPDDNDDD